MQHYVCILFPPVAPCFRDPPDKVHRAICRSRPLPMSCTHTNFHWLFCSSVQMIKTVFAVAFLLCLASAHKSGDVKHKWWSIPEPVATVGKLFYFKLPHDSVVDNTGPIDVSILILRLSPTSYVFIVIL